MDFMDEVMDVLGDGFESDSAGDIGSGDAFYFAIGETVTGALFGYEEHESGQRRCYRFSSLMKRDDWFREASALVEPSGL